MKSDTYIKSVLTVIALLLLLLAFRSATPSVRAADAVTYEYTWLLSRSVLGGVDLDPDMDTLNKISKRGGEVIAVVPITGKRLDNSATGTGNILFIIRYPHQD